MLFSSITFLYFFLPITLILCLALPKRLRNGAILLTSLIFYGWGEPRYIIFMVISILVGWISGLLTERFADKGKWLARLPMIVSTTVCLGMLGYFKYADFFIDNFNKVTGLSIPLLRIALPIGISFYTFQILSYVVDVYRKDTPAQKNIVSFGAYVTMFPQLIAGPIVRYKDIAIQLENRKTTFEGAALGIRRFIIGLSKKVLIANLLGELCDIFKASNDKSVLFFWLYALSLVLHIYFDFSGYSDMAIGIGKILGFSFCENFNYPVISKSVSEWWRRWHMSLGSWFRDYVYIPLGGNRVSTGRWIFNTLVVWGLTGFWHGADWNFIVWGLYFAVFLMLEKFFIGKYLKKIGALQHLYVAVIMLVSFVIFNGTDMKESFEYIGAMFGAGDYKLISAEFIYYLRSYGFILIFALIGATPVVKGAVEKARNNKYMEKVINILEPVVLLVLLVVVTAFLVDGSFNPFLYFRF
ncbi:MAG: MBOAT family protein [Clostridia bacterium]|nr:MBOAT family protein [Clostridia bacterium]MBR3865968.1 MBOAT family protein [Clostridia bacterium]